MHSVIFGKTAAPSLKTTDMGTNPDELLSHNHPHLIPVLCPKTLMVQSKDASTLPKVRPIRSYSYLGYFNPIRNFLWYVVGTYVLSCLLNEPAVNLFQLPVNKHPDNNNLACFVCQRSAHHNKARVKALNDRIFYAFRPFNWREINILI